MSKPIIALIVLGVIAFIAAMVIGVDTLMCEPPCV
jgi:preprotein translocase subunit SecE